MTEEPHYIRQFNRWVPEDPAPPRTTFRARWDAANPIFRAAVLVGVVLLLTAGIVFMSIAAGDAAADGFGPLIPAPAPQPTPYPNGWTP